jgi:hypothetical protein
VPKSDRDQSQTTRQVAADQQVAIADPGQIANLGQANLDPAQELGIEKVDDDEGPILARDRHQRDPVSARRRLYQFQRRQCAIDFKRSNLGAGGGRPGKKKNGREHGPLGAD